MAPLDQPLQDRIDWLFALAERHSNDFASPEAWLARQRYTAQHPTAILVMKCMDGRINIPIATQTPRGIIQPFRNLGGIFHLGWPHLGEILLGAVNKATQQGRQALMVITYHFSKGDERRGCAGFHFRTADAKTHTFGIRQEVSQLFGQQHQTVYPLVCGFETDEEALVVHGVNQETLNMADLSEADLRELPARLHTLLPDMPSPMRDDLLPLLQGNWRHIAALRQRERHLDIEHREWMICVGRGFDWLHLPNLALIIGPYSPDLADPIHKAAGIIRGNMAAGRIPSDGFLLMSSVPYETVGVDKARAELKSRFLARFSADVIRQAFPDLAPGMRVRETVLNWDSRRVETLSP
ncbi:MAG: hypothetical protein RJB34_1159 [Pseudomonadota bacterium]|jgi:hypothetical protein